MRNVAKRMLLGEVQLIVSSWREKNIEALMEARNRERGERILKRVGARFKQQEVVEAVERWREAQVTEKIEREARAMQAKGESILGRVGGRFRQMEVASNFGEWRRNCRDGALEMVSETVAYTRTHIHMDD